VLSAGREACSVPDFYYGAFFFLPIASARECSFRTQPTHQQIVDAAAAAPLLPTIWELAGARGLHVAGFEGVPQSPTNPGVGVLERWVRKVRPHSAELPRNYITREDVRAAASGRNSDAIRVPFAFQACLRATTLRFPFARSTHHLSLAERLSLFLDPRWHRGGQTAPSIDEIKSAGYPWLYTGCQETRDLAHWLGLRRTIAMTYRAVYELLNEPIPCLIFPNWRPLNVSLGRSEQKLSC